MTITKESMAEFERQYDIVNEAAEKLFNQIEHLDYTYRLGYAARYSFDGFEIEYCGCITLKGSYSFQGDCGNITYDLSFEEFSNPEEFLKQREAEHLKKRSERKAKVAEVQKLKEKQEYEQYIKLKAKFENG